MTGSLSFCRIHQPLWRWPQLYCRLYDQLTGESGLHRDELNLSSMLLLWDVIPKIVYNDSSLVSAVMLILWMNKCAFLFVDAQCSFYFYSLYPDISFDFSKWPQLHQTSRRWPVSGLDLAALICHLSDLTSWQWYIYVLLCCIDCIMLYDFENVCKCLNPCWLGRLLDLGLVWTSRLSPASEFY